MTDFFAASAEVNELITYHITNNHPKLALIDKEIIAIFRDKAGKAGGQPVLGKTKKAHPYLSVIGNGDYKYVLEVAADTWTTLTPSQRSALIDHLLCACKVEEDENTGDIKYSIVSPDVFFFYEELKRHGDWRTREQEESGPSFDIEAKINVPGGSESDGELTE